MEALAGMLLTALGIPSDYYWKQRLKDEKFKD